MCHLKRNSIALCKSHSHRMIKIKTIHQTIVVKGFRQPNKNMTKIENATCGGSAIEDASICFAVASG